MSYAKVEGGLEISWADLVSDNHDIYRLNIGHWEGLDGYDILRDLTPGTTSIVIGDDLLAVADTWSIQFQTRDMNPNAGDDNFIWLRQHSGQDFFDVSNVANPVPIPGAVWLLGSGLFGLVAMNRKNKK